MKKELKAIAIVGVSIAAAFWLTACNNCCRVAAQPVQQTYASCKTINGWPIVHDGSLNYDFRCGEAPNHYFTCYGAYPGQGNNVAMYLYQGASFNSQPPIAGPVWATVVNPSDLTPLQRACVKMYSSLKNKRY